MKSTNRDPAENQKVCDAFCEFFIDKLAKIAIKIRDIIASGRLPPPVQLVHGTPKRFDPFENVSDADVIFVIRRTHAKTSPMDFVPTTIIKSCADFFGQLIARLANLSFAEGKFPDMFRAG